MESDFQESTFIFLMVIGILFMLAFALSFVLFVNYSQKKLLKEQMQNQQQAYQYQEHLLHSNILTQEQERKRIARDLHDEIGSKLNIIFLNMHRLKEMGKADAVMESITNEVESILNITLASTRRIAHDLLPPTLQDFGLVETIRELQHNINQLGTIDVDFKLLGTAFDIEDKLVELNLFRILQELISNSIKHGKASSIAIKLWQEKNQIKLNYQDNGCGFDLDKIENRKGLGMKNIESRLHMIKADFQYKTAIGKGVEMQIELPINKAIMKPQNTTYEKN